MARITWGNDGTTRCESGIDNAVLYPEIGVGIPWPGIVSISSDKVGGESTPHYFDGINYLDTVNATTYRSVLTAFSAPKEFATCIGEARVVRGLTLTSQPRSRFGLSYKTYYYESRRYKLHLVYNARATSTGSDVATTTNVPTVKPYTWTLTTVPPIGVGWRPSSHFVLDSTNVDPAILGSIEDILYGSDTLPPRLPSMEELYSFLIAWEAFAILDDSVTGLSQLIQTPMDLHTTNVNGIYRALPTTRLSESPISGLYRMVA